MPSGPPFHPPAGAPRVPVQTISSLQPPFYPSYTSNSPMMGPPQGVWRQPAPIGGLSRPQLLPYPPAFPGPFPLPAPLMAFSTVPPSDSQPPGTSTGVPGVSLVSSADSGMPHELPPGIGM